MAPPEVFPKGVSGAAHARAGAPLPVSGPSTHALSSNSSSTSNLGLRSIPRLQEASVDTSEYRARAPQAVSGPITRAPQPVSGPITRVPHLNPCEALPASEEEELLDLQQDLQADSSSEPVKAGPLPPSRRVRGKSGLERHVSSVPADLMDLSALEMELSRDGVPDLDAVPIPEVPDKAPVPVDFLGDPDLGSPSQDAPAVLSRNFVTQSLLKVDLRIN